MTPDLQLDPPSVRLSIDVATLRHLAVGARGLVRYRLDNDDTRALDSVSLATTLSGDAIAPASATALRPGGHAVLAVTVTPAIAGFHELGGELSVIDQRGARTRYTFGLHVRAAGDGPAVNVVNIDQSSARVVDNSRSTFAIEDAGGLVGDGNWQPVALAVVAEPAAPPAAPLPHAAFAVTTDTGTYQVTHALAQGEISTVYAGQLGSQPVALKIADASSDNDLLQHEARVIGRIVASPEPDAPIKHFARPRDQFRTADGRLGTVFDLLDGVDLHTVRARTGGLPQRHVIWILRRTLAALGLAHERGVLHGNLDPAHLLVRPRDHMVWLVDWCWAVVEPARTGSTFKVLNEIYSPPEVRDRGRATPASDLYALGKCAIYVLGGDPASKTLPDGIDTRLARFLRFMTVESQGGRPQDAWELYGQVERLRQQIWGAHVFVPLDL